MMPTLEYQPGDTFQRVFQWRNSGQPISLDHLEALLIITADPRVAPLFEVPCTVDEPVGDVYASLSPEQTQKMLAGHYYGKIKLIYPGGDFQSTAWFILRQG